MTASAPLSPEAREIVALALSGDADGKPFIVVDKRQARVLVFDQAGRMLADAPALLGSAVGDDSTPGVGDKPLALIRPAERTTPAGRFLTSFGANLKGQPMLWVDYDAAIALHSVAVTNPKEHRERRLATPSTLDNRASYGCINVKADTFALVTRLFSKQDGIVYVLPEVRPLEQVFTSLASSSASSQ
jgi:hypothetical protein